MTLDILDEVPTHLVERYDIVHVGLLVLVARNDPMPLLRNLVRMLSASPLTRVEHAQGI